jgi:hypothetical protein
MGWAGKQNGELPRLMAGVGFDVFIPVDQNLRYQQNLLASGMAVIVLVAPSNRLSDLKLLMPAAQAALGSINPGDVVELRKT